MLTHIAHLITLPPIIFTLGFVQKRNLISWLPIFCLFSPSFLLLHPDWLTPISYFIWSLGQPCVFARLCCFHPCLSSKKKASVVVAHFLFILPFFFCFTRICWHHPPTQSLFFYTRTPHSLVPLGWSCAIFANILWTEYKWKICSSNLWVFLRKPGHFILFYFVVLELRGYFS